ncbi:MAG: hypothetical protein JO291_15765 [Acidimicrobiia bacterium]|nr:hypothetical protein [Acidimicrobiia bacterium]
MGTRRGLLVAAATIAAVVPFAMAQPAGAKVFSDEESSSLTFQDYGGIGEYCTLSASASLDSSTRVLTTTSSADCTLSSLVLTLTYDDADGRTHTLHVREEDRIDIDVDNVFAHVHATYDGTFGYCANNGQTCSTSTAVAPK